MKKNKQGFAIVFAMGMALVSTLVVIYLLEYMIPFSKNVKGIENSTAAYYNGISAVENALYFITKNTIGSESSTTLPLTATGYSFQIYASGTTLPTQGIPPNPGYGNSEFDTNWSRLRIGEPVQIRLPAGMSNLDGVKLFLRVPNIDGNTSTSESIYYPAKEYVNWQISGTGDTLNSIATSRFKGSDICSSTNVSGNCSPITGGYVIGGTRKGHTLALTIDTSINDFYAANCYSSLPYSCSLKFSVINTLNISSIKTVPYLEYKIVFPINVPSNVVRINIKGKSFGFQKEFDIYSPRESLIEAFDFTVFQ